MPAETTRRRERGSVVANAATYLRCPSTHCLVLHTRTIRSYRHDLEDFAEYFSRALDVTPLMDVNSALGRLFRESSPSAHEVVLVKTASPRPYCAMVFAMPVDPRNACALNSGAVFAAPLEVFFGLRPRSMYSA